MAGTLDKTREPPLLAVYLEKREDLKRFFTARLRSAEAAEDLVQEVYLKLAGRPPPDDLVNPAAYLYRLGANLMLDRIKQNRRATARDHDWYQLNRSTVGGIDVAPEPKADDAVAARQRLSRIAQALEEVNPQHGRAFRLHKFEGLSQGEVSVAMGVSVSAVEKWISAVLKHLHARLA